MTLLGIQRRYTEIGRIRTGEKRTGVNKAGKTVTYPSKLDTFRLTSSNLEAIKAAAERYGGTVATWAEEEGQYELFTETTQLDVLLPPAGGLPPYSLFYELWSGGGCQRRCDGAKAVVAQRVAGKDELVLVDSPCLCDADARECKPTLRVGFFLPDVSGFGLWRLESKGYNAAAELPGMLDLVAQLSSSGRPLRAVLRLEQRTSKRQGKTRNYGVPVLDLPYSLAELSGDGTPMLGNEVPPDGTPALLTSSPRAPSPTEPEPAIPEQPAATPVTQAEYAADQEPIEDAPEPVDLDAPFPAAELDRWRAGTHAAMRQRIQPEEDEHEMLRALATLVAGLADGASLNDLTARQWHRVAVALRDLPLIEQPASSPEDGAGEGADPAAVLVAVPPAAGSPAPIEQPQQATMDEVKDPVPAKAVAPAAADPVPVADVPNPPRSGGSPAPGNEQAGSSDGASVAAVVTPVGSAPPGPPTDAVLQARYTWGEQHGFDDEALDAAALQATGISPLEADEPTWQAFAVAVQAGAIEPPAPPPPKPGTDAYKALASGMLRSQARAWWAAQGQGA